MENEKMMGMDARIEDLQNILIETLESHGVIRAMQFAMDRMDFSKETDTEKVKDIQNALVQMSIIEAMEMQKKENHECISDAFTEYATALALRTVALKLDIQKSDRESGFPPEINNILKILGII